MLCSALATFYYSSNNREDVIAVNTSWSISVYNPWVTTWSLTTIDSSLDRVICYYSGWTVLAVAFRK
ncbi:MAG: hypothetical protein QW794_00845 [Thermosphaera sp.]